MRSVRCPRDTHRDTRERGKIRECKEESVAWGSGPAHQPHGTGQRSRGLDRPLRKAREDQRSTPGKEEESLGNVGPWKPIKSSR